MAVTLIDLSPASGGGKAWEALFGESRRPEWLLGLTMVEDEPGRFRCTAARFSTSSPTAELPTKWIARFPVAQCVREARLGLQEWLIDGGDVGLPFGLPTRTNRDRWYPQLLECVKAWQASGMTPMDSYREVARRKRVDVNRVKQWVFVGRRLDAEAGNRSEARTAGRDTGRKRR